MRAGIAELPDGTYEGEDFLDEGGRENQPVAVRVAVTIAGDEMTFDYRATDDVVEHDLNTTPYVAQAASAYAARILTGRDMQPNGGCLRPLRVLTRPGSLLEPGPNRPVVAGNHETANRIVDAVLRAFERALPERVSAGGPTTVGGLLFSERRPDGSWRTLFEVHGGGEGARHDRAGGDATRVHLVNTMNTPVEVIESQYAVRLARQRLRRGSGGAGRHRGGDGYVREYEVLAPELMLTVCVERMVVAPYGMQGGEPGAPFAVRLVHAGSRREEVLTGKLNRKVVQGDRVIIETSGGGGFGAAAG
jgi:N-methylhydantoinase B